MKTSAFLWTYAEKQEIGIIISKFGIMFEDNKDFRPRLC